MSEQWEAGFIAGVEAGKADYSTAHDVETEAERGYRVRVVCRRCGLVWTRFSALQDEQAAIEEAESQLPHDCVDREHQRGAWISSA